ncbi:hypothetical protein niasHT_003870 [Heterodera trifolii]|uniref:Uncharacterized protein n=1 Tax=Heterodera trifolii TaxID=157864 RepID=A0ABD2LV17_9BILA
MNGRDQRTILRGTQAEVPAPLDRTSNPIIPIPCRFLRTVRFMAKAATGAREHEEEGQEGKWSRVGQFEGKGRRERKGKEQWGGRERKMRDKRGKEGGKGNEREGEQR